MNAYLAIVEHTVSVAICLVKHSAAEGAIRLCLQQAEVSQFILCVPMIRLGGHEGMCAMERQLHTSSPKQYHSLCGVPLCLYCACASRRAQPTHTHTTGVSKSQKNSPTDGVELGLVLLFCLWSKLLTDVILGLLTGSISRV